MHIERVQEAQGVTEWVVRDFDGDVAAARFSMGLRFVPPGDVVNVFATDGTLRVVVVLPDGGNMILQTPN